MSKKEAQKKQEENSKAIATVGSNLPVLAVDFGADVGAGMEATDKDSFAIPFLVALQKISPQVDESEAKYVEGAKAGMLLNTVTQRLYDGKEGVVFLPCAYQRRFVRWGARGTDGGGFKGEFLPEQVAEMRESGVVVEHEGRLYFPKEDGSVDPKKCDRLADTRNHFGIIFDEDTGEIMQCILSLVSTQIKKSKQLMSMLSAVKVKGANGMVTPPTWVNKVRITVVAESNDKGSWYGVKPVLEGFVDSQELYDAGREFHKLIAEGAVNVNYAAAEEATDDEEGKGKF